MDVVGLLRTKQEELGIEQQQDFAKLLGISHSHLSLLYSGKRDAGAKVIMGMLKLWPDVFRGDGDGDRAGDGGADGDSAKRSISFGNGRGGQE